MEIHSTDQPQPEKLSLWDRIFNRYKRVIIKRGSEVWYSKDLLFNEKDKFVRDYVEYKIIDRVTGSEKIKREYLND